MVLDLALRAAGPRAGRAARRASTSRRRRRRSPPASARCRCRSTPSVLPMRRRRRRCCARLDDELPAVATSSSCRAASCTCRCRGTTRRPARRSQRYMHGVRADAPWCPWNIEFIRRINGLDDVDDVRRHRVRRAVPRARPRRRLPRRAGRHAARSAPPAGHHQVQPGPHLDAGERGRHRRRLPVHLRHGGPGRLPVRRPHRPGLEPLPPARCRSFEPGTPWLLRFFDRISFYPVSAEELLDLRADMAAGRGEVDDRRRQVLARRLSRRSWPTTTSPSPRSVSSRPSRSRRNAQAWDLAGEFRRAS